MVSWRRQLVRRSLVLLLGAPACVTTPAAVLATPVVGTKAPAVTPDVAPSVPASAVAPASIPAPRHGVEPATPTGGETAVDPSYRPGPSDVAFADAALPTAADLGLLDEAGVSEAGYEIAQTIPDAEWQVVLTRDVGDLERKSDTFLEVSFGLYDPLLAAGDDAPPPDVVALDRGLAAARARYEELAAALRRLEADLDAPEVRRFLPLHGTEDQTELAQMTVLFAATSSDAAPRGGAYDPAGRTSVTALLFGDAAHPTTQAADGLSKMQHDALLLLDRLKQLSHDLGLVSSTVAGWIHDAEGERRTARR